LVDTDVHFIFSSPHLSLNHQVFRLLQNYVKERGANDLGTLKIAGPLRVMFVLDGGETVLTVFLTANSSRVTAPSGVSINAEIPHFGNPKVGELR
jgi:hypothetical protein